jgi:O-phosphoseryl-tRNA(Cys) synthetase
MQRKRWNGWSRVPKAKNPQNGLQARPIENFWALLASAVYAKGLEAKNETELFSRIKRKLKEIDVSVIQTMMRGVRTQLRKIAYSGPLAVMCRWFLNRIILFF